MRQWMCTDPDCEQWCKRTGDYSWEYYEIRDDGESESFYVYHDDIFFFDYAIEEVEDYCDPYYVSLDYIVDCYGFEEGIRIMTECIFEQSGSRIKWLKSFDEARQYIKKRIGEEI